MTQEPSSTKGSRSILKQAVRYIIPLAITVLLVWYMFTKIDFAELWNTIRHGVDYKWILLAMAISVFSHVFRALRWRLQLRAMDITPPLMALCCSIFGTYALNLVFPRLGEVWRCTYIAQRQHTPVTGVIGSMVADRLADTLTVLLLLLLTLVVANSQIMAFLNKYPVGQDMVTTISSPPVLGGHRRLGGGSLAVTENLARHTPCGTAAQDDRRTMERLRLCDTHERTRRLPGIHTVYLGMLLLPAICGILRLRLHTHPVLRTGHHGRTSTLPGGVRTLVDRHGHTLQRRARPVEHGSGLRPHALCRARGPCHIDEHSGVERADNNAYNSRHIHRRIHFHRTPRHGSGKRG